MWNAEFSATDPVRLIDATNWVSGRQKGLFRIRGHTLISRFGLEKHQIGRPRKKRRERTNNAGVNGCRVCFVPRLRQFDSLNWICCRKRWKVVKK